MDEWIPIGGTYEKQGDRYRISDADNNGSVDLSEQDVRVDGGSASVRAGATALNKVFPTSINKSQVTLVSRGKETYCIGLLEFRCSDDKFLGICVGAWDCS